MRKKAFWSFCRGKLSPSRMQSSISPCWPLLAAAAAAPLGSLATWPEEESFSSLGALARPCWVLLFFSLTAPNFLLVLLPHRVLNLADPWLPPESEEDAFDSGCNALLNKPGKPLPLRLVNVGPLAIQVPSRPRCLDHWSRTKDVEWSQNDN